ncbi:MAG: hypothetical protein ACRDIV_07135 [Ktedonobacteraceae bacterium]
MAQVLPRYCPRCGTPTVEGMRFCANCGLSAEAILAHAGVPHPPQSVEQARPAGPQNPSSSPAFTREDQQPMWRTSSTPKAKRSSGRGGLVLALVALLILIGGGVFIVARAAGASLPGFTPTQSSISTTSISNSFPYKGVSVTLVNARQAQNFLDDPNTHSDGMVRLNLQATNSTSIKISWRYEDVAQLVLPGNTVVQPTYVKGEVDLAAGKTQSSLVDFAVPGGTSLAKLTLRIGTANEAQMDIPLKAGADLSRYLSQKTSLTGQAVYYGLNWTLQSAATSLSIPGEQAARGARFLTLTLSVDNTLSQEAITGSPYDYARLKSGNTNATAVDSTLPVSFQAGANGVTGTLSFLMSQKSTDFTLLFLPQGQNSTDQATLPFQIHP